MLTSRSLAGLYRTCAHLAGQHSTTWQHSIITHRERQEKGVAWFRESGTLRDAPRSSKRYASVLALPNRCVPDNGRTHNLHHEQSGVKKNGGHVIRLLPNCTCPPLAKPRRGAPDNDVACQTQPRDSERYSTTPRGRNTTRRRLFVSRKNGPVFRRDPVQQLT